MSSAAPADPEITLVAPLRGWVLPLAEVPDPVFAQGMAGDGVAIDPTGDVLHAPCDGVVVVMPGGRHALTLRAPYGDVLMHVGIDTVQLGGQGFDLLVGDGEAVRSGQPLLRFDLDAVVRRAPSAVTPILLAPPGRILRRRTATRVDVGDFLIAIAAAATTPSRFVAPAAAQSGVTVAYRVPFDHGLHARPAARIAAALEGLDVDVRLRARGRVADARSTVAMMSLGVGRGESVEATASGPDTAPALARLAGLLERLEPSVAPPEVSPRPAPVPAAPAAGTRLGGRVAVPGLACGVAAPLVAREIAIAQSSGDSAVERQRLAEAIAATSRRLGVVAEGRAQLHRDVIEAHRALLSDAQLHRAADLRIAAGSGAGAAWHAVLEEAAAALAGLDDPLMRERRADLLDIERQVLAALAGDDLTVEQRLPERAIVIAGELLPSQLLALDRVQVVGLCMAQGGVTSHVAILAGSMGLPMLVAAGDDVLGIAAGAPLVLDCEAGILHVAPGDAELARSAARIASRELQRAQDVAAAQRPAVTTDDVVVHVYCNLGSTAQAAPAVAAGAEGCGLLRTEFLFLDCDHAPAAADQSAQYQEIATALGGRPLTIRTLDAGGDKPLRYLPLPREENPALGLRGIRTSLQFPQLLADQLQAILQVEPVGQCRVLLPMVNDLDDVRAVRAHLDEQAGRLGRRAPALGVMIETPASALLAEQLMTAVDFVSIGSNDLSQYTLAMDRLHPLLGGRLDALHPAVLRLIEGVVRAAVPRSIPVAVCGGLASDPVAVPILLGLGISELSVVPDMIPRIKGLVRSVRAADCRRLAAEALAMTSAGAVRESVRRWQAAATRAAGAQ